MRGSVGGNLYLEPESKGVSEAKGESTNFLGSYIFQSHTNSLPSKDAGGASTGAQWLLLLQAICARLRNAYMILLSNVKSGRKLAYYCSYLVCGSMKEGIGHQAHHC